MYGGKGKTGDGNFEFYIRIYDKKAVLALSSDGNSVKTITIDWTASILNDGLFHNLKWFFTSGNVQLFLDGVEYNGATTLTTINSESSPLFLDHTNGYVVAKGKMSYNQIGTAIFNFKNDFGTTNLRNDGAGGDATLSGIVGFWNSSDAQLINSQAVLTNSDTIMQSETGAITHSAVELTMEFLIAFPVASVSGKCVAGKMNGGGDREFLLYKVSGSPNTLRWFLYDGTGTLIQLDAVVGFADNEVLDLVLIIKDGVATSYNNGTVVASAPMATIRVLNDAKLVFNSYNWVGGGATDIKFYFAKVGTSSYNFAIGNGDVIYDNALVNNINVTGATLTAFWGFKQSITHHNYYKGFDLWENGTAGEELRVPIGAVVTEAGYIITASYPPVKGLNNCESEIEFPSSLGFSHSPLAYSEFQTDFDSEHKVYSCKKDKNHGRLYFYNPALSVENSNKNLKCLAKNKCTTLLTDVSGNLLTDVSGNYID